MPETAGKYESTDLSPKLVARFGAGIVVVTLIIFVGIAVLMRTLQRPLAEASKASRIAHPTMQAPQPQLQLDEAADLQQMRADNAAELQSYGWVDRNAGVIRIPIERAMDLTATRALPVRKAGAPASSQQPPP